MGTVFRKGPVAVPVTGFAGGVVLGVPFGAAFWRQGLLWDAQPGSEL